MTWLVADVGGTNARFALIAGPGAAPERIGTLRTRDYPGLAEAAAAYLERHAPDVRLDAACLAVAGPVANGRFRLTNADWPPARPTRSAPTSACRTSRSSTTSRAWPWPSPT
ncbi:glucokinase [Actinomadura yumaensis]|uniref:glucokinase n=1 Tax=Actinomadura yumaensis TaxID=111807 RepID=UPI0036132F69